MDQREVRNEFGLDENNESDVRKERANRYTPWVVIAVVGLLLIGGFYFIAGMEPNNHSTPSVASNNPAPEIKGPTPR